MPQKLVLLFVLFVCHAKMQGADTLSVPLHYYQRHSSETLILSMGDENPALHHFYPLPGYTEIAAGVLHQNLGEQRYNFQGKTQTLFEAKAAGLTQRTKTRLFGSAAYQSGKEDQIKWTYVEDEQRIGPYQVADSSSGNKEFESYLLQGGLSWENPLGVLGLSAQYRANNNYRTKNPRSHSVVSDFKIQAGWTCNLGKNYRGGLSVQAGNYQQFLSIANMPNERKDLFYFMYGYGYFNQSISGTNANYSVDYTGNSYGVALQLIPSLIRGWFFNGSYHQETTDALYASRTRGSYQVHQLQLKLGHQWQSEGSTHRGGLKYKSFSGLGTEYYYQTVVTDSSTNSSESRLLSRSAKYKEKHQLYALFLNSYLSHGNLKINPKVEGGVQSFQSSYKTTPYCEQTKHWFAQGHLDLYKIQAASMSGIILSLNYEQLITSKLISNGANRIVQNTLLPNHTARRANRYSALVGFRHTRNIWTNAACGLEASFNLSSIYNQTTTAMEVTLALWL